MRASAIRWEPAGPDQAVPGHYFRNSSSLRRSHRGCDTCQGSAVGSSVAVATGTDAETALGAVVAHPAVAASANNGNCHWQAFGNGLSHSSTQSAGQSRFQNQRIRCGDGHGGRTHCRTNGVHVLPWWECPFQSPAMRSRVKAVLYRSLGGKGPRLQTIQSMVVLCQSLRMECGSPSQAVHGRSTRK